MADKDIPEDNGVGVERHDHGLLKSSSSAEGHLEGTTTATPFVWNASCVSCGKSQRKCDGLRPCRSVVRTDWSHFKQKTWYYLFSVEKVHRRLSMHT